MNRFQAFCVAAVAQAIAFEAGESVYGKVGKIVDILYKAQKFQQTIEHCADPLSKMVNDLLNHIYDDCAKPKWLEAITYEPPSVE